MEGDGDLRNGKFDNGTAADEELDGLKNRVDGSLDRKTSDLGQERSMMADKLSEAEKKMYALEHHNKDLQAQVDELSGQINIEKEEDESLLVEKTQLESQVGNLVKEIESLKDEKSVLNDVIAQLQLQNDQLEKKIEASGGLLAGTQGSLEEVEKERDGLRENNDSWNKQLEGLVMENEELKGRISHLARLERETEVLPKELVRLMEENGRLTIQLEKAQKEIGLLREETGVLQGQLKDSRHEISELKAENEKLQRMMEDRDEMAARKIETFKEECLKLANDKENQKDEIVLLRAQKEATEIALLNAQTAVERDLVDANNNSENEAKRLGEIVEENEKLKERSRAFEVALENFHNSSVAKDNRIRQLSLELQALKASHASEKQKSRTIPWSAVIMSGALVAASTAVIYHKYSKLH